MLPRGAGIYLHLHGVNAMRYGVPAAAALLLVLAPPGAAQDNSPYSTFTTFDQVELPFAFVPATR